MRILCCRRCDLRVCVCVCQQQHQNQNPNSNLKHFSHRKWIHGKRSSSLSNIVGFSKTQDFHNIQSTVGAFPLRHSTHTATIARFGFRSNIFFFSISRARNIDTYVLYHHHKHHRQHHSSLCFFSTIESNRQMRESKRARAHTRSVYDALAKRAQWGRDTCY